MRRLYVTHTSPMRQCMYAYLLCICYWMHMLLSMDLATYASYTHHTAADMQKMKRSGVKCSFKYLITLKEGFLPIILRIQDKIS